MMETEKIYTRGVGQGPAGSAGRRSIRSRLLIPLVALALLPIVVIGAFVALFGVPRVQEQATRQLESVAVLKQEAINIWLEDLLIDLALAQSGANLDLLHGADSCQQASSAEYIIIEGDRFRSGEGVSTAQSAAEAKPPSGLRRELPEACQAVTEVLRQVRDESGRYEDLFLIDRDGLVLASTDPERVAQIVSNQTYFREGLRGAYIQRPIYSPARIRSHLFVSMPVVDDTGEVLSVLAGQVSLDKLTELMAQRSGLGETGQTYLVAGTRTLLTPARTGELNVWVSSQGIDEAIDGRTNSSGLYRDFRGVPVVGAYRWLPELESVLIAEQEQAEAFRTIYTALGLTAGAGLIGLALAIVAALLITRSIATPIRDLASTATQIAAGDLARVAPVGRGDEIGALATAFNSMTAQLRSLIDSLEERVAARTRELEQRSAYLAAAAEVGRTAATILDVELLVQQIVTLIREDFDLYYVGLFLVDESGDWAVLRAGTGEAGHAMLARGHRLEIGGESMIGWCIANRQARIALEVGEDAVRLATPELPDTRSEAALPLLSREQVIGALSVQHTRSGAFDEELLTVLQTMADQIAVALDNARLLSDRQAALEEVQRAYGQISREAWREMLQAGHDVGYRSDERGVTLANDIWRPEMERALQEGQTVGGGVGGDGAASAEHRFPSDTVPRDKCRSGADQVPAGGKRTLAVPIRVRGEVVGVVDTYKPDEAGDWTPQEVALVEEIVGQLDLALESARLYQDVQRRASREETIRRVTEQMRRPREVDAIVQSTLAELAKALGVPRAYVRLGLSTGPSSPPLRHLSRGTVSEGKRYSADDHRLTAEDEALRGTSPEGKGHRFTAEGAVTFDDDILRESGHLR